MLLEGKNYADTLKDVSDTAMRWWHGGAPTAAYTGKLRELQQYPYNWHYSEHAIKQGGVLKVPPWSTKWPHARFQEGVPVLYFLEKINDDCMAIMKDEIVFESQVTKWMKNQNPKGKAVHFSKKLTWSSWSAKLELEFAMDDYIYNCNDFWDCLGVRFQMDADRIMGKEQKDFPDFPKDSTEGKNALFKRKANGTFVNPKEASREYLERVLFHVNRISHKVFDSDVVTLLPNKDSNVFQYYRKILKDSDYYGSIDVAKQTAWEVSTMKIYYMTKVGVAKRKDEAEVRKKRGLTFAREFPEADIWKGVRGLLSQIYAENTKEGDKVVTKWVDHTWGDVGKIETKEQCAAGAMLLQLAIGSRAKGIICTNIIDRVNWKLSDDLGETEEDLKKAFPGQDPYTVTVRRLTKEKSLKRRAFKELTSTRGDEKAYEPTVSELEKEVSELKSLVITKPIIWRFFIPDQHLLPASLLKSPKTSPVDVFMDLLVAVRKYISENQGKDKSDFEVLGEEKGLLSVSNDHMGKASTGNLANSWVIYMEKHLKEFFPEARGTHELRRLYVAYGFIQFAGPTMKEIGFANAVLGHRGYETSLFYTSLKVVVGVKPHEISLEKDTSKRLNTMESLMAEVQKFMDDKISVKERLTQTFVNLDGEVVHVPRLSRVKRRRAGDPDDEVKAQFVNRGVVVSKRLFENRVLINMTNLVTMGVNTNYVTEVLSLGDVKTLINEQKKIVLSIEELDDIKKKKEILKMT